MYSFGRASCRSYIHLHELDLWLSLLLIFLLLLLPNLAKVDVSCASSHLVEVDYQACYEQNDQPGSDDEHPIDGLL